jgi:hypothetical protein
MESLLIRTNEILRTTPPRWAELTDLVSADLLSRPPGEGEWSALQCLQHLIDTDRSVFPVRVRAFLAGEDFPAFDPDSEGGQPNIARSPSELARHFAELRQASLEVLEYVSESDLDRTARHPELGEVTLSEMVHEWAAHDLMHTVQAERALMQPFIQGCGPWRPYFADHIASRT